MSTGISIEAAKSAGPKMMVSRRGEAAQMSSTLMSPRVVSIWASMPMWPTGRPLFFSTWVNRRSSATTSAARLHLGEHDLVETLAGVADDFDHVAVGPLRVPGIDAHAQHPVVPCLLADGVDHLGPSRFLFERGDGVLEVEERHVGGDGGRLLEEALVRPGCGEAGSAGKVPAACGHVRMLRCDRPAAVPNS